VVVVVVVVAAAAAAVGWRQLKPCNPYHACAYNHYIIQQMHFMIQYA